MSILNQATCLKLNSLWQPVGFVCVKKAIVAMCGMPDGTPPALALDITLDEEGNLVSAVPTKWEDWINLPVRGSEPAIATKTRLIRAPLILLDGNYSKMPQITPKLTTEGIHERDGLVDQYTGEKLERHEATVDHVIPKDLWRKMGLKGSPNQWTNMVTCKGERNFRKSNKLAGSMGMVLRRKPKAPARVPASFLVKSRHPHHSPFVNSK